MSKDGKPRANQLRPEKEEDIVLVPLKERGTKERARGHLMIERWRIARETALAQVVDKRVIGMVILNAPR